MSGLLVFRTLKAAEDEEFHVYDRLPYGYLVRKSTQAGWQLAIVDTKREPRIVTDPDPEC